MKLAPEEQNKSELKVFEIYLLIILVLPTPLSPTKRLKFFIKLQMLAY